MIRRFLRSTRGTAAVETAIIAPLFLILTMGITDLGSGMCYSTTVNAASQAGAIYAVIKSTTPTCTFTSAGPIAGTCLSGIQAAMNDATNEASFCTGSVCSATILTGTDCDGVGTMCVAVTANYQLHPILLSSYLWSQIMTISYTAKIRIV